ncbi:hypothetical protein [Streptomyces sp. NPDC005408]|uniref:hypothetical protein n=1 Tax=Streptomyces sp. NPDC005408 TaxID=3155341 RepID=UPI0033A85823
MNGPTSFDDLYNEPDQLRDQMRRLMRYRAVIALGIALGLLCAALLAVLRAHHYTSTGEVVVRSTADPFGSLSVPIDHQLSMATERQVALSPTVAARAAKSLGGPADAAPLQQGLTVTNPPDTQVLRFEYTAGSPKRAARVINAFLDAYLTDRQARTDAVLKRTTKAVDQQLAALGKQKAAQPALAGQIDGLQRRLADLKTRDTTGGDIVRLGEPPVAPAGPGRVVLGGLGLLGGLTLGIMLAWLLSVLEPRVRSVSDLQISLRAPVLGILPGAALGDELLAVGHSHSPLTEAYRTLAFRLTHDERSAGGRSLLVLAPREHRNAEAVAVNLAAAVAEFGHDVVLVDATATTPALATRLPLLPDSADVVNAGTAGRFAVVSGKAETSKETDPAKSVVFLGRALLDHADALALAQRVDGVLVVGGLNLTRRDDLKRLHELIACAGGRVVGAVLDAGARGSRLSSALDGARHRRSKYRRPAIAEQQVEGPRAEQIPKHDAGSSAKKSVTRAPGAASQG